jgi:plastocyanin
VASTVAISEVLDMPRSLRAASLAALSLTVSLSLAVLSCGGGDNNPAAPSPTPTPTPTPPAGGGATATTTITITGTGVAPKDIVVTRGSRVTFVNNDGVGHDMNSDPHPAHTNCPDLNVGFIAGSQSRQTEVLNTARTCGYHDHNQPSNAALQGTIRIE